MGLLILLSPTFRWRNWGQSSLLQQEYRGGGKSLDEFSSLLSTLDVFSRCQNYLAFIRPPQPHLVHKTDKCWADWCQANNQSKRIIFFFFELQIPFHFLNRPVVSPLCLAENTEHLFKQNQGSKDHTSSPFPASFTWPHYPHISHVNVVTPHTLCWTLKAFQ